MDIEALLKSTAGNVKDGAGARLAEEGKQEKEELVNTPVRQFLGGAIHGLTGINPDSLLAAGASEDERALLQDRRDESPLAASMGQVLGFAGGALTGTGAAGLLTKTGMAAGKTLGKVAGKGALSKGLTLSTAGAVEGAGIALSDASNRMVIDNQYGPGAAAAIAEAVAEGAVWGAGGSVAAMGLGATANFLFRKSFKHQIKRYKDLMDVRKKTHLERVSLEDEVARLGGQLDSNPLSEMYGPSTAGARYAELTGDAAVTQTAASLPGAVRSKDYWKTFRKLEDTLQKIDDMKAGASVSNQYGRTARRTTADIDRALEPLENQRNQISAALQEMEPNIPVPLSSHEAYISRQTMDPLGGKLGKNRRKLAAIDKKIERLLTGAIDKNILNSKTGISEAITIGAGTALGGVKGFLLGRFMSPFIETFRGGVLKAASRTPFTRAIASSSIRQGKLGYAKHQWSSAAGDFVTVPYKYDKVFKNAQGIIKAMKVPPIQMLSQADFQEMADEIRSVNLGEVEFMLRSAYASKGAMQESVNPQIDGFRRQVDYLRKTMPVTHNNNWISGTPATKVPEMQRLIYSRRLRATIAPVSVPMDFLQGKLTPEAAHAWWATQQESATEFAIQLTKEVQAAQLAGKKFSPKEMRQIGLMTDPLHQKVGRLKSVNMVQSLQKYYVQEDEQVQPPQVGGPPKSGGVPDSGYASLQNVSEQLQTRANKRA